MTSRVQPEPFEDFMGSQLWQTVVAFLLDRQTGRVTLHVEHGVVRMVEATAFTRQKKENPLDKKLTDRVQSP